MTVPLIQAKYEEKAILAALKKNYSAISQVFDRYYLYTGIRLLPSNLANKDEIKSVLFKYMNSIKDCNTDNCVTASSFSDVYKTYNGNNANGYRFNDGQFILSDGSMIFIEGNYTYISVDVKGYKKKPNRLGKDLFTFLLLNNGKLLPMGAVGTSLTMKTNIVLKLHQPGGTV